MKTTEPSLNQCYAMIIEEESHRFVSDSGRHGIGEGNDIAALWSARGSDSSSSSGNIKGTGQFRGSTPNRNFQKPKRNWNVQCDHCKMYGHTAANCYQLIGYPDTFKGKRKPLANNALYATTGAHQSYSQGTQAGCSQGTQAGYWTPYMHINEPQFPCYGYAGIQGNSMGGYQSGNSYGTRPHGEESLGTGRGKDHIQQQPEIDTNANITVSLSPDQYAQVQRMFPKTTHAPSPSANMAVDTEATNHMVCHPSLLSEINSCNETGGVHLPDGSRLPILHVGSCRLDQGPSHWAGEGDW
ncbi:hypothetical protein KY285_007602 [Solanum tuberosum]|nr:hypothetical protein KY284_007683 [Solanum tuberosum]KAH0745945.1 hypothetical protein KY285_007602 [Solanum tuberosum]